ncbi:hypothetical protein LCGC14_2145980 [marine sediment metagenome]|uniref:Uncharacterized protein n=1 Tax=marine sediment metagenome TaxID=412755 RepID=A0A0F9DWW4_9ZZZZ
MAHGGQFGFGGFAEALASGRESRQQGRLESRRLGMEERELGLRESGFEAGLAKEMDAEIKTVAAQVRANITLIGEEFRKGLGAENIPGLIRLTEGMLTTLSKLNKPLAIQLNSSFQSVLTAKPTGERLAIQAGEVAVTETETIAERLGAPTEAVAQARGQLPAPVAPPVSAFTDELGNLKATVSNSTRQFVAQLFGGVLDPVGNFRLLNPEDAPKALEIAAAAEALLLSGQEQSVAAAVQRASRESGFFPGAPVVQPTGGEAGAPVTEVDVPIGGTAIVFEGKVHDVVQKFPNGDMLIKDREGGVPFRVRSK